MLMLSGDIPLAFAEELCAPLTDEEVRQEFIAHHGERLRGLPSREWHSRFIDWQRTHFVLFDRGLWLANVDATQIECAWAELREMADEAFGSSVGDEIVPGEETVDAYWGVTVLRQPGVPGFTVKLGRERWRAPCADVAEVFAALSINLPPVGGAS
jgi:hypothetical protein